MRNRKASLQRLSGMLERAADETTERQLTSQALACRQQFLARRLRASIAPVRIDDFKARRCRARFFRPARLACPSSSSRWLNSGRFAGRTLPGESSLTPCISVAPHRPHCSTPQPSLAPTVDASAAGPSPALTTSQRRCGLKTPPTTLSSRALRATSRLPAPATRSGSW